MGTYSVKRLAALAGVSVRALHLYDEMGLLSPAHRTESGYRMYGEEQLLRLQQILLYKEMEVPLQEIKEILDDPDHDTLRALQRHLATLKKRKERLTVLMRTLNKTIDHLKHRSPMQPHELYDGLPREVADNWRSEAIDNHGTEAVERSEGYLMSIGRSGVAELRTRLEKVLEELTDRRFEDPGAQAVQRLIARHYAVVRAFWGTADEADPQLEAYAGLGQLYVDDDRFIRLRGAHDAHFAAFLRDAMMRFAGKGT